MPIVRKDRSFDKIFDEVTLEKIPMNYILEVRLHLADGSCIDLDKSKVVHLSDPSEITQMVGRTDVTDVAISLDYETIKKDISNKVKGVLGTFFKEDKEEPK
mgnify:FL=1